MHPAFSTQLPRVSLTLRDAFVRAERRKGRKIVRSERAKTPQRRKRVRQLWSLVVPLEETGSGRDGGIK